MRIIIPICVAIASLSACSKENNLPGSSDLASIRVNLAFTCTHEADRLPALDPDAETLFRYGRYLQTRDGPKNFDEVARHYRIAAAHGHYKANHNVQQLVSQGMASSPNAAHEAVEWASRLVNQGIPMGYYDIGYYLNSGYGLKQNRELALKYIRKAADLGNADAQYHVSELLAPHDKSPDVASKMLQCAANQGHGRAAFELGIDLKYNQDFRGSAVAFQKSVVAGNSMSALVLERSFSAPPSTDRGFYLDLPKDPERSRRYQLIGKFLDDNELANPKVPDIDKIVPLPPAKLPPWDGTFEWEKQRAQVPPKPSDELINRLAKEKNLDPATGLPLSPDAQSSQTASPADVVARVPLGTVARTGTRCPESGVWCAQLRPGLRADTTRAFKKGEVLPMLDYYEPRSLALLDRVLGERRLTTEVMWKLVAYEVKA
ncbi:sel1 repeat family protein [Burkholderia sola]|uniref:SEL1-like repeat protein n=1 Tax=Burkholderia TaxID=32008 RepID=UPI001AE795AA|nr:sel1 repeat family protein [Burkholderia sp. AcTa6-5]MBP0712638.1 sel1 repeat family protein [Burkholderia sp. AcTa6-5]